VKRATARRRSDRAPGGDNYQNTPERCNPVASRLRFLRPIAPAPVAQIDMQKLVYDLVLARANAMFGPGSSFTVTIRKDDDESAMFTETVVETLAWDVSRGIEEAEYRAKLTA
jgi:hypothetical protein